MKHRYFKLSQVKARIEYRKEISKRFRVVTKEELKEKYGVDWPPTKVVVVDDEDNLTPDVLKERSTIILTKEEAQKVEEQFSKPNHELLDKIKAKLDSEELQNSENPLSGMLD